MKKTTVKYARRDGRPPLLRDGMIRVSSPFAITLRAGESRQLDLGVSFDRTLLVFENNSLAQGQGVRLMEGIHVVPANTPFFVGLRNDGKLPAVLEGGDAIVYALPLSDDFSLEEG